jgi:hypothetical protein
MGNSEESADCKEGCHFDESRQYDGMIQPSVILRSLIDHGRAKRVGRRHTTTRQQQYPTNVATIDREVHVRWVFYIEQSSHWVVYLTFAQRRTGAVQFDYIK